MLVPGFFFFSGMSVFWIHRSRRPESTGGLPNTMDAGDWMGGGADPEEQWDTESDGGHRGEEEDLREGHFHADQHHSESAEAPLALGPGEVTASVYGQRISAEAAAALVPPSKHGLIWHARLVRDDFHDPAVTTAAGRVKARRPMPVVTQTDFFSSLSKTADHRWIFSGVLNGWPGLQVPNLSTRRSRAVKCKCSVSCCQRVHPWCRATVLCSTFAGL